MNTTVEGWLYCLGGVVLFCVESGLVLWINQMGRSEDDDLNTPSDFGC